MIGNEPNQPRFWMPQYRRAGKPLAAAAVPARCSRPSYDALKAVDPTINVIGIGLSPRGNDQPLGDEQLARARRCASCTTSASPTGRAIAPKPLMDELAFHPYPEPQTATRPTSRYVVAERRPRRTSTGSSRRSGTPSTEPRSRRSRSPAGDDVHEAAQVRGSTRSAGRSRCRRPGVALHSASRPRGRTGQRADAGCSTTRDAIDLAGAAIAPCGSLSFFHLMDEPDLDRWQSGLERVDG